MQNFCGINAPQITRIYHASRNTNRSFGIQSTVRTIAFERKENYLPQLIMYFIIIIITIIINKFFYCGCVTNAHKKFFCNINLYTYMYVYIYTFLLHARAVREIRATTDSQRRHVSRIAPGK